MPVLALLGLVLAACTARPAAALPVQALPSSTGTLTPVPRTATRTVQATASPSPTASPQPTDTIGPSATPTSLACWQAGGSKEDGSLRTPLLPLPLEYRVLLPPCYEEQPERRYPVLYLIHGQNYNNDQWDRLGAGETADALVAAGEIAPFIMVLPRDRNWDQPDKDRFGQAVVEVLIPFIDTHYHTLPDRQQRSIGGLSRGAGWAVHLGLSHWELFGALGAHSLPVFWADTPHIRAWLDAIPAEALPRIYLDTGEKDYLIRSTLWFAGVLNDKGIPHEWYLFPGYHEEAYWQSHIETYLRWYTREW